MTDVTETHRPAARHRPWRIVRPVVVSRAAIAGRATLFEGDSTVVLKSLASNSVDSVVTDPPYALASIIKRFGNPSYQPAKGNQAFVRASRGFMGQTWDTGDAAHDAAFWRELWRVLKPGAFVLAFGGTRTYHRLACAIEDAGFEIRDMVQWLYGSGFPKSHDVSKGVAGAVAWEGWGTALKPACEPICMARKPLSEGTVAANVLRWGTGAININGCRVDSQPRNPGFANRLARQNSIFGEDKRTKPLRDGYDTSAGRWPANVITDGSDEVVGMFPAVGSGGKGGPVSYSQPNIRGDNFNRADSRQVRMGMSYSDSGSAARFFYQAKASKKDRAGSQHPTVKPVALMRYLCRLVTPPGGIVLDPFAGTGTTGEAAHLEGFKAIMIEREVRFADDIRSRYAALKVDLVDGASGQGMDRED